MRKAELESQVYLLDTHAWIWLATGAKDRFKPALIRSLEEAGEKWELRISAVTPWETSVLHRKKRLRLSGDPLFWIQTTIRLTRVQVVPLSPEIAVNSETLPGNFHGDPADRMIVACARATGSALVTADRQILKYCDENKIKTASCG
jgi:PIN domain nuclease of toxin-antitoxin system